MAVDPAMVWRNSPRLQSGDECLVGRVVVGSAYYDASRSKGDPLAYRASTTLPGIRPAVGKDRFLTMEEAKACTERLVRRWFELTTLPINSEQSK